MVIIIIIRGGKRIKPQSQLLAVIISLQLQMMMMVLVEEEGSVLIRVQKSLLVGRGGVDIS